MSTERTKGDPFAEAERLLEEDQRRMAEVRRRVDALIARLSPAGDPPQNDETNGGAHGTASTQHETSAALVDLAATANQGNRPAGNAPPRRAWALLLLMLALLAVGCGGVAETEPVAATILWSSERAQIEVTVEREIPAGSDMELVQSFAAPPTPNFYYGVVDFVWVDGVEVPAALDIRDESPVVVTLGFQIAEPLLPGSVISHIVLRCSESGPCQPGVEPIAAWFSVDGVELARYEADGG